MNKRLLRNYKKAFNDSINYKEQKSNHWKRYYNNFEKFYNEQNLINFRNKLNHGLDDSNQTFTFEFYIEAIKEIGEDLISYNLNDENIGNCFKCYQYKDKWIDKNTLYCIYWYKILKQYVFNDNNINNICEIGGGYGALSRILLKNHDCKIISIDLPEANLLTSYHLMRCYPDKKFYLYDDYINKDNLTLEDYKKYDVFILPPWCKIDDGIKIDLFINTRSMMEMNKEVIQKYFDLIHKHISIGGYFFCVNRYIKYMKDNGIPIRFDEYPYDNNWETILSKESYKQPRVHMMLTKRNYENNNINIKDSLKEIKQKTDYFANNSELFERETPIKIAFMNAILFILSKFFNKNFIKGIGNKLTKI